MKHVAGISLVALFVVFACATSPTFGPGVFCDQTTPCVSDPLYSVCDPFTNQCMVSDASVAPGCSLTADCPANLPLCDQLHHACAPCSSAADDSACLARSPTTPRCDPGSGLCGVCRAETAATDCTTPTAPVCSAGACRGCLAHSECPSAVCNPDGSCAAISDVAYVDNASGACTGTHSGTKADPYCEIADAVTGLGARKAIHVAGSTTAYHRVDEPNATTNSVFIGPGRAATPRATITDASGPCFNFAGNSVATIDGFELTGCQLGVSSHGVPLQLLRSDIHDNLGVGVEVSLGIATCRLDGDLIHDNRTGGGLALHGVTYDIENCFFSHNQGTYGGVYLDSSSVGTFAFNTVRDNISTMYAGGVECDSTLMIQRLLESSIVVGNNPGSNGTQFGTSCTLSNVVGGAGETFTGAIMVNPAWADPADYDYHLLPLPNNAKIINAIGASSMGTLPNHDIDGAHRPQGSGWDIGAQEVE